MGVQFRFEFSDSLEIFDFGVRKIFTRKVSENKLLLGMLTLKEQYISSLLLCFVRDQWLFNVSSSNGCWNSSRRRVLNIAWGKVDLTSWSDLIVMIILLATSSVRDMSSERNLTKILVSLILIFSYFFLYGMYSRLGF